MAGLLDFMGDPDEEDKYGVTRGQRQQMGFGNVAQLGAMLMAAGQPISDAQRAQILAQLGGVAGQGSEQMMMARQLAARNKLANRTLDDRQQYQSKYLELQQQGVDVRRELAQAQQDARNNRAPPGMRMTPEGKLEAIPGYIEFQQELSNIRKPQDQKPLGNSDRDDLMKVANPALDLVRITNSYKKEYGGYGHDLVGDAVNLYSRNSPWASKDQKAQAQWWQDYAKFSNMDRHSFFGATLTPGEKAAYKEAMVNSGMAPDQIEENLGRQRSIMLNAVSRYANSMRESGIKPSAIESAMGMKFSDLPNPMAPPNGTPQQAGSPAAPSQGAPMPAIDPSAAERELRRRGLLK